MERLDKVISSQTNYSRKDVKLLVKKKKVFVNNVIVLKSDWKVNVEKDKIVIDNQEITIKKHIYLLLNKPKGYVSATKDNKDKTVLDLVPLMYQNRNLFPAGRLDKDTTGMMIITDDGEFAHNILAPNKHVKKKYRVVIDIDITDEMIKQFMEGVILIDGICQSAELIKINNNIGEVVLKEGRYHQIKRMFGCFKAKVLELERIEIGNLVMPNDLHVGNVRELTKEELNKITEK